MIPGQKGPVWLALYIGILAVLVVSGGAYWYVRTSGIQDGGSYWSNPQVPPVPQRAATSTNTNSVSEELSFSATPSSGNAPLQVAFTIDKNQFSPTDNVAIDFGDGETTGICSIESKCLSNPINHLYAKPGTYFVNLTESGRGRIDGVIIRVSPVGTAPSAFEPVKDSPLRVVASYGAGSPWIASDAAVDFGDGTPLIKLFNDKNPDGAAICGQGWNYVCSVGHTYKQAGTYTIHIVHASGCSMNTGICTSEISEISRQTMSVTALQTSVPGMSQYTNSSQGFSFLYPVKYSIQHQDDASSYSDVYLGLNTQNPNLWVVGVSDQKECHYDQCDQKSLSQVTYNGITWDYLGLTNCYESDGGAPCPQNIETFRTKRDGHQFYLYAYDKGFAEETLKTFTFSTQ